MDKKQRGLTTLELLIVMAIMAMAGSAGAWQWHTWQQRHYLLQSATQLRAFLMKWRDNANWRNTDIHFHVVREGTQWCLTAGPPADGNCRVQSGRIWAAQWPGIELAEMTDGLGFYGVRNTARAGRFVLRSQAGEWHIIVSAWGRVRLCQAGEKQCEL